MKDKRLEAVQDARVKGLETAFVKHSGDADAAMTELLAECEGITYARTMRIVRRALAFAEADHKRRMANIALAMARKAKELD